MVLQMGRVLSIILIIACLTLPASNWSTHAHWKKIEWVPFRGRVSGLDVLENVLLFFPFGFLHACTVPPRPALRFWRLLFLGAALSTAGECFQIFCHNRFPSTTDVLTNTAGTILGALAGQLCSTAPRVFSIARQPVK